MAVLAFIGLVRVSTENQEANRQHDALDPLRVKVFEEKVSGKLGPDARRGGKAGGRPSAVDADKCAAVIARWDTYVSIREIACGVGASVGTIHRVLAESAASA